MRIYLDYQATTPLDKRVLDEMMPTMTIEFGNAGSKSHSFGWEAEKYVENARRKVASVIGADAMDVIFTSGATESNNLAIKGVARFNKTAVKNHIITTKIEHKCVLETCKYLGLKEGFDITFLNVDEKGLISLDELKNAISERTILVSIMCVNNEIGTIQPLKEIGKICRERGVYFHTDCAQAFGKIPLDVDEMNIDLLSLSGHKIYGPKGVGALYIRRKPRVKIEAIIHGGGQERGLRSGTLAVPLIVGLGKAAGLAKDEMQQDKERIDEMADRIIDEFSKLNKVYLNGDLEHRWKGCLNFSFAGVEGESLMMAINDVALSSGSACTSSTLDPSYVIQAIGVKDELAHSSLRIGLGRFTTKKEVEYLIQKVKTELQKLRDMSPLWEMMEKGVDFSKIKWRT
ncbi:MAG: IscS subfamily cysteine desulfurase [Rickettsiales bacterium]|jgi:cysteine desulfurase|nr:IscS subfamily cysteine desulfurase [Rickettsiales bacterium]